MSSPPDTEIPYRHSQWKPIGLPRDSVAVCFLISIHCVDREEIIHHISLFAVESILAGSRSSKNSTVCCAMLCGFDTESSASCIETSFSFSENAQRPVVYSLSARVACCGTGAAGPRLALAATVLAATPQPLKDGRVLVLRFYWHNGDSQKCAI
ncbi:hypothetical protein RRG08_019681 [Elysia crispata]|uniref:Uncharacterized protein n=1 Tax=Elysia crispata TaxID=231223 RepID=A0AAE0YW49_9GAST|nr:hypothetical protein RRG08_019681 [Elysia crispata]